MNSAASKPVLIGVDWGTSSLRAFLIGGECEALDGMSSPQGIMHVEGRDFDAAFCKLIAPWLEHDVPILASGMITSRNGWIETDYVSVPSGPQDLAEALVRLEASNGRTLHMVTGMTTEHDGAPDVMRGEETQIVGAVAQGANAGVFVMPGTHSKWITVTDRQIQDYATYMTGDIFAALSGHTILGTFIEDGPFQPEGFLKGVTSGLNAGKGLLHSLFHARTMPLFGKIPEEMAGDFLSGILIGSEIGAATEGLEKSTIVTIVGRSDLADRYELALEAAGFTSSRAAPDIVARGHLEIAQAAGLFS